MDIEREAIFLLSSLFVGPLSSEAPCGTTPNLPEKFIALWPPSARLIGAHRTLDGLSPVAWNLSEKKKRKKKKERGGCFSLLADCS